MRCCTNNQHGHVDVCCAGTRDVGAFAVWKAMKHRKEVEERMLSEVKLHRIVTKKNITSLWDGRKTLGTIKQRGVQVRISTVIGNSVYSCRRRPPCVHRVCVYDCMNVCLCFPPFLKKGLAEAYVNTFRRAYQLFIVSSLRRVVTYSFLNTVDIPTYTFHSIV